MAGRRLDREAAERVLRRAVQIGEVGEEDGDQFDLDVLVAAASDLGVPSTAVHRAMAEEQAGLLDADESRLDRLVGPAVVSAARVVPTDEATAMSLVDEWLRRAWGFKRKRSTASVGEYRRRTDAVASMQRSARSLSGKEQAEKVKRLRVVTRALDPGAAESGEPDPSDIVPTGPCTIVALVVDIQGSRSMAEAGGGAVAGAGTLASAASALVWVPWAWIGVPASAAAGAGVLAVRRSWTRGIDVELEGLLDKVAAGERPPSVIGGLTDRLLGGT